LNRTIAAIFVVLALATGASASGANQSHSGKPNGEGIVVEHAEIVLAPPGGMIMAGYLAIWNGTGNQANLQAVESGSFASVSIHNTIVSDGVARMRPVEGVIPIPGNSELLMQRGGLHLMLSEPAAAIEEGETVDMTLEDGRRIGASARVLAPGQKTIDHHHGEADGTGNE
jgi:copper(I)-binding protein